MILRFSFNAYWLYFSMTISIIIKQAVTIIPIENTERADAVVLSNLIYVPINSIYKLIK